MTGSFESHRSAIARIVVVAGSQTVSRGTGTLIAPNLVLSALHVVANRKSDPPEPYPGEVRLEFPGFTTTGTILKGAWDRVADWVLIECAEPPPDVTPMPLAALAENKRDWESFGFPDANSRDGLLLTGNVVMCDGKLEGTSAHQLYCTQAAAGGGGRVKGMSGAPVVIDGKLVGVMRFALMEQDRTEMGTLYACPVRAVADRWPTLTVLPLPRKPQQRLTAQLLAASTARAGWELGALAAALTLMGALVLTLSRIHVPTTLVKGEILTNDAAFLLAADDTLLLNASNGLLSVKSVDVTGAAATTLPAAGGAAPSRVLARSVHAETDPRATRSQLAIDLGRMLRAGTGIVVHRTPEAGRYALYYDSLSTPLRIQFTGAALVSTGGAGLAHIQSELGDELLVESQSHRRLISEFELLAGTSVKLDAPVRARRLSFFDRQPAPAGGFALQSTVQSGSVQTDDPYGESVAVAANDSLVIGTDTLNIDDIAFPSDKGAVRVRFSGVVSKLSVGSGPSIRNLMPTWLERLRRGFPLQSGIAAAAFASLIAYLIVRWRRKRNLT